MPITSDSEVFDERTMQIMRDRRAKYQQGDLLDFGIQLMLTFELLEGKEAGDKKVVLISRSEGKKLINDLWRFGFRPDGMKYCEGNHAK